MRVAEMPQPSRLFPAVLALLVCGCGQTHEPGIAGVDETAALSALTEAQWEVLCEWRFELRGDGELTDYWCGGDLVPVVDEPPEFPKAVHHWGQSRCVFYNSTWDSCVEICPRTVRDFVDCSQAEDRSQCFRLSPPPECAALYRACGDCRVSSP